MVAETGKESVTVCPDPVFVLCAGRSGSTLLRFLLDSHPALTCPPETRIPWLCTQLASAWSVIEDAPADPGGGGEAASAVLAGLRASFEPMISSYLARSGKKRFCDKSLGGAVHSNLLAQMWPGAQFVSLHRHPMDLIGSGIEAAPWGLSGYGFDSYAAASPGNSVVALARYWGDYTSAIVAAEERLGPACIRLRYEDLVADPEQEAKRLFDFLGEEPVPGITETIFSREQQRSGPGDHKIWQTSKIGTDSVGRGWNIPARLLPPPLLAEINALAGRLGYLPVGPDWGTGDRPGDIRAS
jgi:hypothetical protein